ncbi:MAG: alpha-glucosidase [Promethearchaeota archaeon]
MNHEKKIGIDGIPWWKKTTIYQIYPRSFKDSTGNGIGDLQGIISKLDYIKDLGVETIWFSPFYSSPQGDFGYDISNYQDIAPEYGTMDDFDNLVKNIHDRNMKIVLDMVLNHTSDQHKWFLESKSSRDNPKRDWYVWKDGKKPKGKAPPNNWKSFVTGSGWHYDSSTDQWYWASFLPFQPDLNYRNPEVKKYMMDMVRFWLQKGVDGFRLDILGAVYEDPEFRNNPLSWRLFPSDNSMDMLFKSTKYTVNHPDNFKFAKELRKVIDEFQNPPRFLIGEVSGSLNLLRKYCGNDSPDGLNLVFLFQSMGAKLKATIFRDLIKKFEKYFPEPFLPTWVFSNHDIIRHISRFKKPNIIEKAKLISALQLTVRGVPVIYYGEEIGMKQHFLPFKDSLDAVSFKFKKYPSIIQNFLLKITDYAINRDGCRTPMQWNDNETAGFSPKVTDTWLPVNPNYKEINVEKSIREKDSLFHCYQRFLEIRKKIPALNSGDIKLIDSKETPKNVLGYSREIMINGEEQIIYVYLNFRYEKVSFQKKIQNLRLIASTIIESEPLNGQYIILQPFEGIVFEKQKL